MSISQFIPINTLNPYFFGMLPETMHGGAKLSVHLPPLKCVITYLKIHPCLKLGGLLYLKVPWGGHITHLDDALNDFYSEGGRKLLSEKYKLLRRLKPLDIAGVYRKIKR